MTNISAAELVPRKLVTLGDSAIITNADISGFKFVHAADYDETAGCAVTISGCKFTNCDFSELRPSVFIGNRLDDCIWPPMEIWAEFRA